MQYPLISCICITRNRPHLLQRAIACFIAQIYEHKEIVILFEIGDTATEKIIQQIPSSVKLKVIVTDKTENRNLGYLRNIAINAADGEYICQWDDDDWYHVERLSYQYHFIQNTNYKGSILSRWLLFDHITRRAYNSCIRLWEGSILCTKEALLQKEYEDKKRGEDTAVIMFLSSKRLLKPIPAMSHLYIYNFHGKNTFEYNHFKGFLPYSIPLGANINIEVENILQQKHTVTEGSTLLDRLFNNSLTEKNERNP